MMMWELQDVLGLFYFIYLHTTQTNVLYTYLFICLLSHLPDEPESKKLAAQCDLDSAKALCEFHQAFLCL